MTFSDLERPSKIFNDTKRRAVASFLLFAVDRHDIVRWLVVGWLVTFVNCG